MEFSLRFQIERSTTGRYGIEIVAVDAAGTVMGQPAQVHDAVFSTAEEAAERVVMALRGTFRTIVPGFFPSQFLNLPKAQG